MVGRRRKRKGVAGVVVVIVSLTLTLMVFASGQEHFGEDFTLPEFGAINLAELADSFVELVGWNDPPATPTPIPISRDGEVSVHFIDVGQGESILIMAPEKTVLIDGGDNGLGPVVADYLAGQGVYQLDILIATHPHADHIGGLIYIIGALPIDEVILPEIPDEIIPTTQTYTNFLTALLENDLPITIAEPGQYRELGGGALLTILGPVREYAGLNDMSVISRLVFGEVSFLFTGDAEAPAESDLAIAGGIASTVLNVGHHGSHTSTTQLFLDAVSPRIAVISAGLDNRYGHPHRVVMERLMYAGIMILRTDLDGDVVIRTDGQGLVVEGR